HPVDKLGARIQGLATRLSDRAAPGQAPAPPDPAATEGTYRQVLWRWFELAALGAAADRDEVLRLYQELLRLMDEVGEPRATRLRRQWAREWWEETGVCPFCGERGPYHDPDRGGEAIDG
ncbi:MAG: hypothetical protein ACE5JD_16295, partial [Candidatus Methylomirabilia bacterium]